MGLGGDEILAARGFSSSDPKVAAALGFARAVLECRGGVTDEEVEGLRGAGYADAEVAEVVANVALNVLTNHLDRVAETEIDFPRADPELERSV